MGDNLVDDINPVQPLKKRRGNHKCSPHKFPKADSELDSPRVLRSLSERQRIQRNQICWVEEPTYGGSSASDGKCKTNMQRKDHRTRILTKSGKVIEGVKPEVTVDLKELIDDECDEDYQAFFHHLSFDGEKMVLKYKNWMPIVYDEQPNGQTQLSAVVGGSDARVMGYDNCQYIGTPSNHSSFKEQVMRILRKPYDSKEHQMLSQDILARKSIAHNIDLRNGREQTNLLNKDGKSYLDHYYDLKRKLQAAKTAHEELKLLRGFFFWLQNLTQEGAFKPWLSASCLAV